MRRFCLILITYGLLFSQTAWAVQSLSASQVYRQASMGTVQSLRALRSLGTGVDNIDRKGNTALCQAISAHDYRTYNILRQAGANIQHPCVKRIPSESIQKFNTGYSNWIREIRLAKAAKISAGTEYVEEVTVATETGLSTGAKVAIGVGALAVIGGGVALAVGGGGGGGSSGSDNANGGNGGSDSGSSGGSSKPDTPTPPAVDPWVSRDPETYKTPEFNKGNFLSQIKAEQAYARGFSGYVTEQKTDAETGTITYVNTPEKVRVGVLDSGTDINHPDLIANIAKDENGNPYGYNFDYGPCRGDDKTNCYGFKPNPYSSSGTGAFVFFDENGETTSIVAGVTQSFVDELFVKYADDYDWDKEQNNPFHHQTETQSDEYKYNNTMSGDHGTHVAGIIGASKNGIGMHGVAPNVDIVAGIYDRRIQGFGSEKAMETYAAEKVRVINMSFGYEGGDPVEYASGKDADDIMETSDVNFYKMAAENNIVIVKGAGNNGNKSMYIDHGIPLTTTFSAGSDYDMTNLFISVVAASPANTLASYSQICGAGQSYCLTAPGGDIKYYYDEAKEKLVEEIKKGNISSQEEANDWGNQYMYEKGGIYSTVQSDENHVMDETGSAYGYMQGTSMATPVVTGSVALLMGAYPHLTSQEVVEILFRSANKKMVGWTNDGTWTDSFGNTYATSSIFGHGMVDLDAATNPLGELMLATQNTTNGAKISLKDTKLALPRGFNASLSSSLPQAFVGLDDYNRAFPVVTQTLVSQAHRSDEMFKRSFRSFMNRHKVKTAGVQDKMSFSFSESITDDDLMGLGALDVRYRFSDKQALHFAYRSDVRSGNGYFNEALSNPFVDMTDAYALTNRFDLNKKTSLSFGAVLGKNGFYEGDEDLNEEFNRSVTAFTTELTWKPAEKITLKAIGGLISEKDAVLGLNGRGAFNTDTTRTYFAGAVVEVRPISSLTLSASYYYGRSQESQTSSLMTLSDLTSDSFALDARYHMDKETFAGIQLSSPLGIRSGRASFNLPVARNLYNDTVYRDQFDISLKSQAREYNLGAYYAHETDDFEWRYELGARIHPDHMEKAKPDYRALFGLRWQY